MSEPVRWHRSKAAGLAASVCWTAGAALVCSLPASAIEGAKPPADWPLGKIQYQKWSYQIDLIGMPMQMPVREFSNCVDRDHASRCSFDDPNSPCKVTTLERVGLTQKMRLDCPDMKGLADFTWAEDGTSWSGTFQMEGAKVPPGMGMRMNAKYLGPCSEKDVRR